MDILSKTDDEIYELAKPIWDNLVKSSNLKDYGGFTKDFSTQMLFGANEVEPVSYTHLTLPTTPYV